MTGQKDRYTTTEKMWKLDDDTLKTPKHDEMILWLLNDVNIKYLFPEYIDLDIQILSEDPLTAENGFLVGYLDIVVKYTPERTDIPEVYKYIEVKPNISSFGSTLRQLKTYNHYLGSRITHSDRGWNVPVDMYLFTTDLRFKEAFESQGIKVLTYPDQ